ncbi:peroxisomal membrane protein PMP34 [Pimephales promelas]|uniref:peroxisomal membrane protein PMP34 n=1 Tax=Pimephales promelas TaxID=90988 RepID=UPI001955A770|nr:peroxisomal membrane protein PMP34-like isoform X1 [Pimephales promelas]XP_039543238.1 peroxisomal membrane protein PMP34 [Pimephales promelas]KAG1967293.1 peroxisomal membrane protein PMP34 [Pimephales promelas]
MGSKDLKLLDVFSYESLVHAVAGAMGSVTAMTVFFPLDTARLRLQVDEKRKAKSTPAILSEIIKEEGLLAPYRGWFPVICSLCCSNFVYFYCFHSLKATWLQGQRSTPGRDLIIGVAAGVVNVLVTTPLWVVNTRLKLQGAKFRNEDIQPTHYRGIMDAFVQIMQQEGVGALWNGTFPSLLLVLNPAVQFMLYEGLKRHLLRGVNRQLSSVEVFLIGAIAKAIATTITYPLQTVQSVLRFGQHGRPADRSKLLNSLRSVMYLLINRVRKWGMLGLFKGLEAKLLQTVLTAALMFLLYEKIANTTFRVMGVKRTVTSH